MRSELSAGGAAVAGVPAALWLAPPALAVLPDVTAPQPSLWFCPTAACSRTLGCTIVLEFVNCALLPVHRPCSTQNTSSGKGSDPAGTLRSFPIIRSCFPPLTSSPANSSKGRLLRLIRTSWLTLAPLLLCGKGIGRPSRDRANPAAPCSLTITSPLESPSSNVRNAEVSCPEELTTGKIVMFS